MVVRSCGLSAHSWRWSQLGPSSSAADPSSCRGPPSAKIRPRRRNTALGGTAKQTRRVDSPRTSVRLNPMPSSSSGESWISSRGASPSRSSKLTSSGQNLAQRHRLSRTASAIASRSPARPRRSRVMVVPSSGSSRATFSKLRSPWNTSSQLSPERPVCTSTASGSQANTLTKPMPKPPAMVRSPLLPEENRRVSSRSMIASSMPAPVSRIDSSNTTSSPSSSRPGSVTVTGCVSRLTSTRSLPASIAF